jgi:hypothetical protein
MYVLQAGNTYSCTPYRLFLVFFDATDPLHVEVRGVREDVFFFFFFFPYLRLLLQFA